MLFCLLFLCCPCCPWILPVQTQKWTAKKTACSLRISPPISDFPAIDNKQAACFIAGEYSTSKRPALLLALPVLRHLPEVTHQCSPRLIPLCPKIAITRPRGCGFLKTASASESLDLHRIAVTMLRPCWTLYPKDAQFPLGWPSGPSCIAGRKHRVSPSIDRAPTHPKTKAAGPQSR